MAISVIFFILFHIFVEAQSAREQSNVVGYDIVGTEKIIRNTANNLFSTLRLKDQKLKLKQHSTIHNFFTSMTLQDHHSLKEIQRLTKVDSIDNSTQVFIAQLNEVLDEDYKSNEEKDAIYVTNLIVEFVENLDNLKEIYGLKNNGTNFSISKDVIAHLNYSENDLKNATILNNRNDSDENVLSENEFWQPSGRRIYDGRTANIRRFPFMASVLIFKKFQCAGSILKSDLVITAASCLQLAWNNRFYRENPAFLSVQVGSSLYDGAGDEIPIMEIHFHPNYNPKNLRHNLAILRLFRTLKFGARHTRIKKIEIDKNPWPMPTNTDGITIVGWGAKSSLNTVSNSFTTKLSYAVLDFYPLPECQEVYSKEFVTTTNFCAGFMSKGGGACNHDVGGPGLLRGVLVGVISFSSPVCGAHDAPTVFTKLGFYADWIHTIMELQPTTHLARTTKIIKYASPYKPIHETASFTLKPIDDSLDTTKTEQDIDDDIVEGADVDTVADTVVDTVQDTVADIVTDTVVGTVADTVADAVADTNLRINDKVQAFEEFLDTMFNSNEVMKFVDEIKETKLKTRIPYITKYKYDTKTTNAINMGSNAKTETKSKSKVITQQSVTQIFINLSRDVTTKEHDLSLEIPMQTVTVAYRQNDLSKKNMTSDDENKFDVSFINLINSLEPNKIMEYKDSSLEMSWNERQKNKLLSLKSNKILTNSDKTKNMEHLYRFLLNTAKKENDNSNDYSSIEESKSTVEDDSKDYSEEYTMSNNKEYISSGESVED